MKTDKLTLAYERNETEIAQVEAKLKELMSRRHFLEELGAGASGRSSSRASADTSPSLGQRKGKRRRAASGMLPAAIKAALEKEPGLDNGGICKRVKADGYQFSLATTHVSRTLSEMVRAGELEAEPASGNRFLYRVKGTKTGGTP